MITNFIAKFSGQSKNLQTLEVFLFCNVTFIPIMYFLVTAVHQQFVKYLLVSGLGWTAGAIIVGFYIYLKRKE